MKRLLVFISAIAIIFIGCGDIAETVPTSEPSPAISSSQSADNNLSQRPPESYIPPNIIAIDQHVKNSDSEYSNYPLYEELLFKTDIPDNLNSYLSSDITYLDDDIYYQAENFIYADPLNATIEINITAPSGKAVVPLYAKTRFTFDSRSAQVLQADYFFGDIDLRGNQIVLTTIDDIRVFDLETLEEGKANFSYSDIGLAGCYLAGLFETESGLYLLAHTLDNSYVVTLDDSYGVINVTEITNISYSFGLIQSYNMAEFDTDVVQHSGYLNLFNETSVGEYFVASYKEFGYSYINDRNEELEKTFMFCSDYASLVDQFSAEDFYNSAYFNPSLSQMDIFPSYSQPIFSPDGRYLINTVTTFGGGDASYNVLAVLDLHTGINRYIDYSGGIYGGNSSYGFMDNGDVYSMSPEKFKLFEKDNGFNERFDLNSTFNFGSYYVNEEEQNYRAVVEAWLEPATKKLTVIYFDIPVSTFDVYNNNFLPVSSTTLTDLNLPFIVTAAYGGPAYETDQNYKVASCDSYGNIIASYDTDIPVLLGAMGYICDITLTPQDDNNLQLTVYNYERMPVNQGLLNLTTMEITETNPV